MSEKAPATFVEPGNCIDVDDRINLWRLATAAVLWRLVDGLEKAYGPAHQELYEVHLARGLAKALDELAKSSLEPGLASFIEAPVSKRVEQFLNSAETWAGYCDGAA